MIIKDDTQLTHPSALAAELIKMYLSVFEKQFKNKIHFFKTKMHSAISHAFLADKPNIANTLDAIV